MAKREITIRRKHDTIAQKIIFTVVNQADATKLDEVEFDYTKAHRDNRAYAEIHGWFQRLGDAAALSQGETWQSKVGEIRSLVEHYESGGDCWNVTRTRQPPRPLTNDEKLALAKKLLAELGMVVEL